MDNENKNRVYTASMTFSSVEGEDHFTLDVDWKPSLVQALEDVGGDEQKLPPSYRMMLGMISNVLNPSVAYEAELKGLPAASEAVN